MTDLIDMIASWGSHNSNFTMADYTSKKLGGLKPTSIFW